MEDKELRQKAKSLKIRNWHNKKIENLLKEIAAIEGNESLDIDTSEDKKDYLTRSGFNFDSLKKYAKELGATKIIYRRVNNTFECYKEECSIEFLSIGMF